MGCSFGLTRGHEPPFELSGGLPTALGSPLLSTLCLFGCTVLPSGRVSGFRRLPPLVPLRRLLAPSGLLAGSSVSAGVSTDEPSG